MRKHSLALLCRLLRAATALGIFTALTSGADGAWIAQQSGTQASFRGLAVGNAKTVWASGTKGTLARSTDAGRHWSVTTLDPALDFRDIEFPDPRQGWLLASGPGEKSRLYRTADSGNTWQLNFTNPDPTGFFDAIAFFNKSAGLLLGDPVAGRFVIYTAQSSIWTRQTGPEALPGEGVFAASGTCLIARGNWEAWFGTSAARVFHSTDRGRTWTSSQTPLTPGKAAGVFSLAFRDSLHGIAVGGDYTKPAQTTGNIALTDDGGRTWREPRSRPAGYRSAVQYLTPTEVLATGPTGTDISRDSGITWQPLDPIGYNSLAVHGKTVWAAGPEGRLAHYR